MLNNNYKKMIMKKMIYMLTVLLGITVNAQEIIVPIENLSSTDVNADKYYFKDVNNVLDKYLGTWKYETATESLEVTFTKIVHNPYVDDYTDIISGQYVYIKNGVTIINTFPLDYEEYGHFIFGEYLDTLNKLDLFYSEPDDLREWKARLILDYNFTSPATLNWHVKTFSRKTVGFLKVYPYQIPKDLVLIKQ